MASRVKSTFICKKKSTPASCKAQFLTHKKDELQYVEVKGDGNCFFRSIAAYYKRTGKHVDGVTNPQIIMNYVNTLYIVLENN